MMPVDGITKAMRKSGCGTRWVITVTNFVDVRDKLPSRGKLCSNDIMKTNQHKNARLLQFEVAAKG